ncbi:hypothetical protein BC829DRAFT_407351, partial [Chytridium lagenaria]
YATSSNANGGGIRLTLLTIKWDCIPTDGSYSQSVQSLMEFQDKLPFLPFDVVASRCFAGIIENIKPSIFARLQAHSIPTHKRRAVPGYYGFGTAMPWNPLSLDAGLMTYSRLPLLSKRYLKFQAQTDAISRGALFCVIKLSHGKQILHINVHLSQPRLQLYLYSCPSIDELCDHIQESYSTLSSSIILVGDLNIEYGSNTRFQQLNVALCARLGLTLLPRHRMPQRSFVGNERDPKSELVDYILVSEELGVVEELRAIEQGQGAFGDHLPIAATLLYL